MSSATTIVTAGSDERPAHTGRRAAAAGLTLMTFTAFIYLLTMARFPNLDAFAANVASWRIATTGVPWVDGLAIPQLDNHRYVDVWLTDAPNGHRVVARSPGVIAAGVPAYMLAGDHMTTAAGNMTAALLGAAAVLLAYAALLPRLGVAKSVGAALIVGFTTPVWSVAGNEMWPHTLTVLGIFGMAWAAGRERWWLVGLFGGVALWGRLHAAIIVAVLGLGLALVRRRPGIAVVCGTVSGAFLMLECAWCRWMYGSWDPTSAYDAGSYAGYAGSHGIDIVNQLGFWISPDRGILVWTPLILVLAPALMKSWRTLPDWVRLLFVAGVGYTLIQGLLNRFSGGMGFYGYRLGLEFLACATPALAMSAEKMGRRARSIFAPMVGIQFGMILPGAIIDAFYVKSEDVWTHNALINAVRLLPAYPLIMACLALIAILAVRIARDPRLGPGSRRQPSLAAHHQPDECVG
jgi:hypothetical protein